MASQKQKLVTTQRLAQTLSPLQVRLMRLLEMPVVQVEEEVRKELDINPALDIMPASEESGTETQSQDYKETAEDLQRADYADSDDLPVFLSGRSKTGFFDRQNALADTVEGNSISYLTDQLDLMTLDQSTYDIACFIIGSLDDNGYFTLSLPDTIELYRELTGISIGEEQILKAMDAVRSLEPAGIGAVDLRDCLLRQLERQVATTDNRVAHEIVADWFDVFVKKHYQRLALELGVSNDVIGRAVEIITSLDPKPAASIGTDTFESSHATGVTPDFVVEIENGTTLNLSMPDSIPELTIEASFSEEAAPEKPSTVHDFIKRHRAEASDFISLINNRRQTLFRIMSAIVKLQLDYFLTGEDSALRPMGLKDIAAITGDNLSTISRATSGKYVSTPWRIVSVKHLFSEKAGNNTDASQQAVMAALKNAIEGEDSNKPLSDDALCRTLAQNGYTIARRTVTKYREQLRIPVARLRRNPNSSRK